MKLVSVQVQLYPSNLVDPSTQGIHVLVLLSHISVAVAQKHSLVTEFQDKGSPLLFAQAQVVLFNKLDPTAHATQSVPSQ